MHGHSAEEKERGCAHAGALAPLRSLDGLKDARCSYCGVSPAAAGFSHITGSPHACGPRVLGSLLAITRFRSLKFVI